VTDPMYEALRLPLPGIRRTRLSPSTHRISRPQNGGSARWERLRLMPASWLSSASTEKSTALTRSLSR
ncbi:MAG: hypothetical protein M1823_009065, partial [Watsoniomyces obsoletus]